LNRLSLFLYDIFRLHFDGLKPLWLLWLCTLCLWVYLEVCVLTLNTGNIGNVPLVLIAALCRDKSNPFGDSEKCSKDGTAYISFGQWVGFQHFSLITGALNIVVQASNMLITKPHF
jgi:hypothetical protein